MISACFPCESIKCHVHHGHFLLDILKQAQMCTIDAIECYNAIKAYLL